MVHRGNVDMVANRKVLTTTRNQIQVIQPITKLNAHLYKEYFTSFANA
jgi:hypothetical protein